MKYISNISDKELKDALALMYKKGNEESNISAIDIVNELKRNLINKSRENESIRNTIDDRKTET